jgi:hypothetical protein
LEKDKILILPDKYWRVIAFIALLAAVQAPFAKTRWSSLHLIPDADFLEGGQFVMDAEAFYFGDSLTQKSMVKPAFSLNLGIIEWVNLELGYAGGPTLGFKARILGESGAVPSLAIGAHNILTHKEAYFFNSKDSTMANEFYVAFGKSIDPLKMRLHFGLQSIPKSKTEQINPFLGVEEYFGSGLYATLELERRKSAFWPSAFCSYRLLRKKLEIAGGIIGINRMLFDKNNKFAFSLTSTDDTAQFVRPGIWFGLRYCFNLSFGKKDIFMSVDDKIDKQTVSIELLKRQIDTLKKSAADNQRKMAVVDNSINMLSDSVLSDKNRLRSVLLEKIITLKTLYESEPFDPEQTRQLIGQIVALKDNALPSLKEFVADKKQDRHVRLLGISLIGNIGGTGASDILLDVLSQSEDPDIKIEILIALGKIKETRAIYVMEQMANDPTDVVAFTAQEVLQKLAKDKGIKLSSDLKMRTIAMPESSAIIEKKIPVSKAKDTVSAKLKSPVAPMISNDRKAQSPLGVFGDAKAATVSDSSHKIAPRKPATADSSKPAPQPAPPDDVWGVQTNDTSKAAPTKPDSVKKAIDAPISSASGDTTALHQAGKTDQTAKPVDKKSGKKEKPSKKLKDKQPASLPVDDKNW